MLLDDCVGSKASLVVVEGMGEVDRFNVLGICVSSDDHMSD